MARSSTTERLSPAPRGVTLVSVTICLSVAAVHTSGSGPPTSVTPLGNTTVALRGAAIGSSPALVSVAESCVVDPAITGAIASTLNIIGGGDGVTTFNG